MKGDAEKLRKFSEMMLAYGLEAKKEIKDYGALPVYIGGDDLLFFAPVASYNGKADFMTIFDLVAKLDTCFHSFFPLSRNSPTLSYGISISYYKYPLNEALKKSYDLLLTAKDRFAHDLCKTHPHKNAIAFKMLKHSGQSFGAIIDKRRKNMDKDANGLVRDANGKETGDYEWSESDSELYGLFQEMTSKHIEKGEYINSITHNLSFFQDMLGDLLLKQPNQSAATGFDMVQNLFDNNYNEAVHAQNETFIEDVVKLVHTAFMHVKESIDLDENPQAYDEDIEKKAQAAKDIIYSTLRFIDFISETKKLPAHVN